MDKEKYIGYSVDELLEDQEFVLKVNNIKKKHEWDQFLQSNLSVKDNIIRARKIILFFKIYEGELSTERKNKLWKNISSFDKGYSKPVKSSINISFLKIAAGILLVIALGASIYLGLNRDTKSYSFSELAENQESENPYLLLSNGTKVEFTDSKTEIVVLKNKDAVLINNDSLVSNATDKKQVNTILKLNEVNVPYGKETSLLLADGTKVWLNAGSRFAFPQEFEGSKREVRLEGEAYFEVAKDKDKPFIVTTANIDVEVLGTKFNLSAYQSDIFCETVLLEGSVNISSKGKIFNKKISLSPNQKATYSIESKGLVMSEISNAEMYISWIDGWYQFSNEKLSNVLDKLERYYNVKFIYDNTLNSIAFPISGKLEMKNSLEEVMAILSKVAKIKYQINDEKVIINN